MIEPSKTYQTRHGRPVRIYATDAGFPKVVHGAYLSMDGWQLCDWHLDGIFRFDRLDLSDLDLVEVQSD